MTTGLDSQELCIGFVRVSYGGRDLGFTTDDGVKYKPDYSTTKFQGAQASVVVHKHRTAIGGMVSFEVAQMSLENWQLLEDLKEAPSGGVLVGAYKERPTERELVLTMPAPNGGTRTMVATASVSSMGEIPLNNKDYQGFPVELELLGDPETNQLWVITDTASSASAPNASSFQTVTSGGSETTLTDAATGINVALAVQATFPVAIRPDQLKSSKFMLKAAAGNGFVAATVAFGETAGAVDYTKVKVTPVANLTAATAYDFIIPAGLLSQDAVVGTGNAIQFTTA